MGLLSEKTAIIFGVANDHSIAWGIAKAFAREGATLGFSYAGEALERRVKPLAASLNSTFVEPCDVSKDEDIAAVFEKVKATFGQIDIVIHSIGFANRDELNEPTTTPAAPDSILPSTFPVTPSPPSSNTPCPSCAPVDHSSPSPITAQRK